MILVYANQNVVIEGNLALTFSGGRASIVCPLLAVAGGHGSGCSQRPNGQLHFDYNDVERGRGCSPN